jgi:peptide/nickel transport system substrate-binding protein
VACALAAALAAALLAVPGAGGGVNIQAPRVGGQVAILPGQIGEPPCLNDLVRPCGNLPLPTASVLYGAYSFGPDLTYRPALVSRVDFTRSAPFTLTYRVRPEARWSDGVPVSAADFVFTHEAIRAYGDHDLFADHLTRVRSVRALGPKTVQVVLDGRFAYWRTLFGVVLPAHALRGENLARIWTDGIDDPRTGRPIGSGPFLVGSWERGKQLTLVRNERWWGPRRPYLDRIVVRFPREAATLGGAAIADLFRSGEVDIAQRVVGSSEDLVPALRRPAGVGLRFPLSSGWEHLDLRVAGSGHTALEDKRVRRAVAHAIDRVAIVRALFGDILPAMRPLDSVVYFETDRSYRPNWRIYRRDVASARRLLEQAGCRRGADEIYVCRGERLSFRLVSRGASARRAQTLELVRAQLRQVGIDVVPSFMPSAGHDATLLSGDFDLTLFSWFVPDERSHHHLFGCGGSQNFTGYCQRLVNRELAQATLILDEQERARVLNRADAQLARDVPVLPLFQVPAVVAVRSTVRGFVPHTLDPTWKAEDWWLAR